MSWKEQMVLLKYFHYIILTVTLDLPPNRLFRPALMPTYQIVNIYIRPSLILANILPCHVTTSFI